MSASRDGALIAIREVRAALETLGDGLAAADLDRLLRAEPVLEAAVSRLTTISDPIDRDDRRALATELTAMTGALARCRVLGQALTDAIAICLQARGDSAGYDREGREQSAAADRRSLEARV